MTSNVIFDIGVTLAKADLLLGNVRYTAPTTFHNPVEDMRTALASYGYRPGKRKDGGLWSMWAEVCAVYRERIAGHYGYSTWNDYVESWG